MSDHDDVYREALGDWLGERPGLDDERPTRAECAEDDPPRPWTTPHRGERRDGWTLLPPIHRRHYGD